MDDQRFVGLNVVSSSFISYISWLTIRIENLKIFTYSTNEMRLDAIALSASNQH